MISGKTTLIAHIGYPTEAFKAPMIYNPYFDHAGIDAVVVPMGVTVEDFPSFLRPLFNLTNIRGSLITMPHKVTTVALVDDVTPTAQIAGACNAILKRPDGSLLGDMFDGTGFVRGVERKGRILKGARALVVGSGGVGSAIAASFAAAGVSALTVFDMNSDSADALAERLRRHYPEDRGRLRIEGSRGLRRRRQRDSAGHEAGRPVADGHRPHLAANVRR